MKAIFLLNNKGNVDYVYSKESQERIKNLTFLKFKEEIELEQFKILKE